MAKKTRKVIKQESQQRAIQQALNNVATAQAVAAKQASESVAPSTPVKTTKSVVTNGDEYAYVKRDLRRIGLLAGSFTVLLIALSFFIH